MESTVNKCQRCGSPGAITYEQRTRYVDHKLNIVTLCPICKEENDDYWDERWEDFYSDCL
jgi:hypothetical protein